MDNMYKKILSSIIIMLSIDTMSSLAKAQDTTFQPPPSQAAPTPDAEISPSDITTRTNQLNTQNQTQLQNQIDEKTAKTPPIAPLAPIVQPEPKRLIPTTPQPTTPLSAIPESNLAPPVTTTTTPTSVAPPAPEVTAQPTPAPAPSPPQQPAQLQSRPSTTPLNKPTQRNIYTGFQGSGSTSTSPSTPGGAVKGSGWDVKY